MVLSFKITVATLYFIYFSLNQSYCYNGNDVLHEGQPCVAGKSKITGCCRRTKNCPSALVELKNHQRPTICSFAKDDVIVCCLTACYEIATTEGRLILDYNETTASRSSDQRISKTKCLQYINTRKRQDIGAFTLPPDDNDDDKKNYRPAAVGGEDARVDEYPHMAAIAWYSVNGSLAFNCGGTLISEKFVLTAAHCTKAAGTNFLQPEPSIVRLGEQNILDSIADGADPIDIPIKRIIVHPEYKPPKKYYDIALIELNNTVKFSSHIMPACLWENKDYKPHIAAVVTGWGTTVSGGTSNSPVLQKVWLDIIDDVLCDSLLLRSRNRHWNGLQEHQMCAGVLLGGKDACQGDSGGPLQVLSHLKGKLYHIIGITSFGKQCAKANQPGIYTKVSYFLDWIEDIVWPKS